jgi:hypothetical protein
MCSNYEINLKTNVAIITVIGNCDVADIVKTMKAVTSDSSFNSKTGILIDKSQVSSLPTVDEAHNLADALASIFKNRRIITVAPETCLFGLNRMISTLSGMKGCHSMVVRTLSEAFSLLA